VLYAPQCHLGFLNFDKSGGFITIPDQYVMFTKREKAELNGDEIEEPVEEGVQMVRELQEVKVESEESD